LIVVADLLEPGTGRLVVDAENPWPGLPAFRERDAQFFHGRSTETETLKNLVFRNRLTVLFGTAGLGKTSLLRAGLSPILGPRFFPVYLRLDFEAASNASFSAQVADAVAAVATVSAPKIEAPIPHAEETLWEYFHRQDAGFWDECSLLVTPVLIFDQLEEVFTRGRNTPARQRESEAVLTELADLVEGRPPAIVRERLEKTPEEASRFAFSRHSYRVLLSLREDFLPDFESWRSAMPSIIHNRLRLLRLNGEQALRVLESGKDLIAEHVAEHVVRFVAKQERESDEVALRDLQVDPALLSVFCRELNNKRRLRGEPKITEGLLTGNREEILTDFYERSLEAVPASERRRVREFIEDQLITRTGFRASLPAAEAEAAGVAISALDELVDQRLLRISEHPGLRRYELAHDVLTDVVRASRDRRQQAEALFEEKRQKHAALRQLRLIRTFVVILAALLALVGLLAWWGFKGQGLAKNATIEAIQASKREREQRQQAQEVLASWDLQEATNIIIGPRQAEGLAYLGQAVRLNPSNYKARSLLHNQLLYRGWHLLRTAVSHPQAVRIAHFSPDGKFLVTGSADFTARVWDSVTGQPAGPVMPHTDWVTEARFSPDGKVILTVAGRTARLWDWRTAKLLAPVIRHGDLIQSAGFSRDGLHVVTSSRDGFAKIWDSKTGNLLVSLPHAGKKGTAGGNVVASAQFSPDGRQVVTASWNQTARIWDTKTGQPIGEIMPHDSWVLTAEFSSDGRQIVTGTGRGSAQVWDVKTGQRLGLPLQHKGQVVSVHFSPDNRLVVTASFDGTARVWNAETGLSTGVSLRHGGKVFEAVFSPEGSRILTASSDGTARLWDARDGQPIGEPMRHSGRVVYAEFSREGKSILTAAEDGTSRVWDAHSRIAAATPIPSAIPLVGVAFGSNGRTLTAVGSDGTVTLFNARTMQVINRKSSSSRVGKVQFSSDNKFVALLGEDGEVRTLETDTGTILGPIITIKEPVGAVALSADGQRIAVIQGTTATLWDTKLGQRVGNILHHTSVIRSANFSRDGRLLLTVGARGEARLWEGKNGRPQGRLEYQEQDLLRCGELSPDAQQAILCSSAGDILIYNTSNHLVVGDPLRAEAPVGRVEFSPDGRRLLAGPLNNIDADNDRGGILRIWDISSSTQVGEPLQDSVQRTVCFRLSPDGTRIATGGIRRFGEQTGLFRLWDGATGSPIGSSFRVDSKVVSLNFSPDGQRIVVLTELGTASIWDVPTESPKVVEQLEKLADLAAGCLVNEHGKIATVASPFRLWTELHQRLGSNRASTDSLEVGEEIVNWLIDPALQSVSPLSNVQPTRLVQQEIRNQH
jgi:WD40 repeat protein